MRTPIIILSALMLTACAGANYRPLVDRPGPNYEADLRDCQEYAKGELQADQAAVIGAVLGALFGAAVGHNRIRRPTCSRRRSWRCKRGRGWRPAQSNKHHPALHVGTRILCTEVKPCQVSTSGNCPNHRRSRTRNYPTKGTGFRHHPKVCAITVGALSAIQNWPVSISAHAAEHTERCEMTYSKHRRLREGLRWPSDKPPRTNWRPTIEVLAGLLILIGLHGWNQ